VSPVRARFDRRLPFFALAILIPVVLLGWYYLANPSEKQSQPKSFSIQRAATEMFADPVRYATNQFTGGIGIAMIIDPPSGLPMVGGVIAGSPAEAAGLLKNDILLEINHIATKGKTLAQAVEMVRGLTVASVNILVQRNGTNHHCVVSRTSWKTLRQLANIPESPPASVPRLILPPNRLVLPPNDDLLPLPSALPLVQTNF